MNKTLIIKIVGFIILVASFIGLMIGVARMFRTRCGTGDRWDDKIDGCRPNCEAQGQEVNYDTDPVSCREKCEGGKTWIRATNSCECPTGTKECLISGICYGPNQVCDVNGNVCARSNYNPDTDECCDTGMYYSEIDGKCVECKTDLCGGICCGPEETCIHEKCCPNEDVWDEQGICCPPGKRCGEVCCDAATECKDGKCLVICGNTVCDETQGCDETDPLNPFCYQQECKWLSPNYTPDRVSYRTGPGVDDVKNALTCRGADNKDYFCKPGGSVPPGATLTMSVESTEPCSKEKCRDLLGDYKGVRTIGVTALPNNNYRCEATFSCAEALNSCDSDEAKELAAKLPAGSYNLKSGQVCHGGILDKGDCFGGYNIVRDANKKGYSCLPVPKVEYVNTVLNLIDALHSSNMGSINSSTSGPMNRFMSGPEYYDVRTSLSLFPSGNAWRNLSDEEKVIKFMRLGNNAEILAKMRFPGSNVVMAASDAEEKDCTPEATLFGSFEQCQNNLKNYDCPKCQGECCNGECVCAQQDYTSDAAKDLLKFIGGKRTKVPRHRLKVTPSGKSCENKFGKYGFCVAKRDSDGVDANHCAHGYHPETVHLYMDGNLYFDFPRPSDYGIGCVCVKDGQTVNRNTDFGCGNISSSFEDRAYRKPGNPPIVNAHGVCFPHDKFMYQRFLQRSEKDGSKTVGTYIDLDKKKNVRAKHVACFQGNQCDSGRCVHGVCD